MTAPGTPPPTPAPDENEVKSKFKSWIGEVLDEREVRAKTDREAAAKKEAEDAAAAKAANPLNAMLSGLFGKM